MILVKIELHPKGDSSKARELGRIKIGNTATGTTSSGDYTAALFDAGKRRYRVVEVKDFPRKRLLAFDLLFRVLRAAVGDRNGEK